MRKTIRGQGNIDERNLLTEIIDPVHLAQLDLTSIKTAIPFVIFHEFDGSTSGETLSYNIPRGVKFRLLDCWSINTGVPSGTVDYQVNKNTSGSTMQTITLTSTGDTDVTRTGGVSDALQDMDGSAGDFIRFLGSTNAVPAQAYNLCVRVL